MQPSLAELVREWHDFYTLAGTAAATLVGLMFVAASIGAQIFSHDNRDAMGAFITPTVLHFSAVLYIALVVMVPVHEFPSLAILLLLAGVAGSVNAGRVWLQLFIRPRFQVDLVDRLFYALAPVLGHLLVVAAAGLLFARSAAALPVLAAALLILLAAGIRNAWDMTIWFVLKSPTAPPPDPQKPAD